MNRLAHVINTTDDVPGRILHWNFFIGGHLSASVPVRLVDRTDEGQLVWMETGAPMWRTELPGGAHLRDIAPDDRPATGYPVVPDRWPMGSALFYQPTDAAYSVLWLFGRRGKFRGWYVNLERRVHHGDDIDIADHELDINVAPDRSWQWKDEESFAEKTGHPVYWSADEAAAIRAEGTRVARLAEAGTFPFDGSWCDFRPPKTWTTPPRPPGPRRSVL
ncbi:DUF402 domain-containing protein [Streptomyces sp. NPDC005151]